MFSCGHVLMRLLAGLPAWGSAELLAMGFEAGDCHGLGCVYVHGVEGVAAL